MKPIDFLNLIPSISSYQRVIDKYEKALKKGEFYEEPIGEDSIYPDW
ncbi:hypothetical protein OA503_06645 [Prochlorococcus sp. AH-716-K03]|nr:hypothetical protein [Prochlorococcus sp. AH-716-K03]